MSLLKAIPERIETVDSGFYIRAMASEKQPGFVALRSGTETQIGIVFLTPTMARELANQLITGADQIEGK